LVTWPDPKRRKWKGKLLKELREACDRTDVSEPMIQILVDGLYHELDDCQMENTTSHPDNLQQLIAEQNNIGWDQLLYSRFTLQWTVKQYRHLVNSKIEVTRKNSGTGWIRMLIKIIWTNINLVWIERNLVRHGKDEEEKREKERTQCISEITV